MVCIRIVKYRFKYTDEQPRVHGVRSLTKLSLFKMLIAIEKRALNICWGRRGRDRMVVGFTTTCAIIVVSSWRGVLDTILCDKVYQWLATSQWFSQGTPVFSTNKNDCHDITEILLKVALKTINQTKPIFNFF